jgi:hypothetical protein
MSDESDIDVMNCGSHKGKRSSRIEDSGSSSDSPVEQCKKRKRVLVSNFLIFSLVFVNFITESKFVISYHTKIKCKTTTIIVLLLQHVFNLAAHLQVHLSFKKETIHRCYAV